MGKENPVTLYLAVLSTDESRRTQANMLAHVSNFLGGMDITSFDWASMTYADVMKLREWAITKFAPASVNKMLCGIRGVLHAAWRDGQMSMEAYQSAVDFKNVMHSNHIPGRMLEPEEIRALLKACEGGTAMDKRDKALLQVLVNTGLRRNELIALNVGDYDVANRALVVYFGKAHQKRIVYISEAVAGSLAEWLLILNGNPETAMFCSIRKGQNLTRRRLSSQAVYEIIHDRAAKAGIKEMAPHDMRRTFISTLLDKGVDIATVAQIAGHADVNSTFQYDRRGDERKRRAADLIDFK